MALLKTVLDSLESLPEGLADYYAKQTSGPLAGKFLLATETVRGVGTDGNKYEFALDDIGGLRTNLGDKNAKLEKANARLSSYKVGDDYLDPKEYERLAALAKTLDGKVDKDAVDALVQERIVDIEAKHKAELESANERGESAASKLHKMVAKHAATEALVGAGAGEVLDILLPHVLGKLDVVEVNGEPTAVVHDNGQHRFSTGGQNMLAPELVSEMREQDPFSKVFPGQAPGGTGAPGSSSGAGGGAAVRLTREQAGDPAQWDAAQTAAKEAGTRVQIVG